jgi:hypothetical protein
MENEEPIKFGPGHPRYVEAMSLEATVAAIRKGKGKKNPSDFVPFTAEWDEANDDFLRDLLRALGDDPDAIESDDSGTV